MTSCPIEIVVGEPPAFPLQVVAAPATSQDRFVLVLSARTANLRVFPIPGLAERETKISVTAHVRGIVMETFAEVVAATPDPVGDK